MGCDTKGKIKGYVKHEDICNFIKENWDKNVVDEVSKQIHCPLTECDWKYKINEHSEDDNNWYAVFGFICFDYNGEKRQLYYDYSNLNSFENQEYYMKRGLSDMVECESVSLILGYWVTVSRSYRRLLNILVGDGLTKMIAMMSLIIRL